jgi:hypothetical protein
VTCTRPRSPTVCVKKKKKVYETEEVTRAQQRAVQPLMMESMEAIRLGKSSLVTCYLVVPVYEVPITVAAWSKA